MRMIAAITPADRYPPPYLNVTDHGDYVVVTLRGEPDPCEPGHYGATATMRLTATEWANFARQVMA